MSAQPLPVGAYDMSVDIAKIKFLCDNALKFRKKISERVFNTYFGYHRSFWQILNYCCPLKPSNVRATRVSRNQETATPEHPAPQKKAFS